MGVIFTNLTSVDQEMEYLTEHFNNIIMSFRLYLSLTPHTIMFGRNPNNQLNVVSLERGLPSTFEVELKWVIRSKYQHNESRYKLVTPTSRRRRDAPATVASQAHTSTYSPFGWPSTTGHFTKAVSQKQRSLYKK